MATAKQKIIDILFRDGAIDNYFAIDSRLTTRLGAYINVLSKQGWEFTGDYLKGTKNYQYVVVKYPNNETDSKRLTGGNATRQVLPEVLSMPKDGSSTTPQPYLFGTATEL